MKVPLDATLDVQTSIKDIIGEIERLKNQWVIINGSRLTGAQDAVTATGLVTLRQLNALESREISDINGVLSVINKLKVDNSLK